MGAGAAHREWAVGRDDLWPARKRAPAAQRGHGLERVPQPDADRKDAYKSLPELRQLIREGKYAEAERFANARFNGPAPYNASYQTLGDLNFAFQLPDGAVTNYRRWLDLDSALAGVEFTVGRTKFQREIFCSAPDGVLVERLASSTAAD